MLFAGLALFCVVKNCDLGLENAVLGCGLGQHFQVRSQFFTIRTSHLLSFLSSTVIIIIITRQLLMPLFLLFSSLVSDSSDSNGDVDISLILVVQQMLPNFWGGSGKIKKIRELQYKLNVTQFKGKKICGKIVQIFV